MEQHQSSFKEKGFTLLELLIVIGIIAILSVILVFVLNPAETLKKSRDSQRIADLATLKTALGLYLTTVSSPDLGNPVLGTGVTTAQISYSYPQSSDPTCAVNVAEGTDVTSGSTFNSSDMCRMVTAANYTLVSGAGWVPVNLGNITGGSPISNLPIDPTNTVAVVTAPTSADLVYRYTAQEVAASPAPANVFEFDAILESATYGPGGSDDKSAKDGGDNDSYYEVGTSLKLMGTGSNY